MSDIPEIPPQILVHAEQAYAEANERLDSIIEDVRSAIELRTKLLAMKDDSYHYMWVRDFIINNIASSGSLVTAVVLSAALFKLARAPLAEDPLAHYEEKEDNK